MRLKLKATAYGNIDHGQNPEEEIANTELQADAIKELREKVQEWQELEGLGGGNWGDCPLFLNNKLVGYMSYNGRVWKDKLRSLGGSEVADSQL
jgi:hypothetical protein